MFTRHKSFNVSKVIVSVLLTLIIVINGAFLDAITLNAATKYFTIEGYFMQDKAREQIKLINAAREDENCWQLREDGTREVLGKRDALTYDYTLEKIAMERARDLVLYFEHQRPNGDTIDTIEFDGVTTEGENIHWASGFTEEKVVQSTYEAFLEENEPYSGQGHRRTMFEKEFKSVGIACFVYKGEIFWVQEFGTTVHNTTPTSVSRDVGSYQVYFDDSVIDLEYGIYGGNIIECTFGYEFSFANHPVTVSYFRLITSYNPSGVTVEWVPDDPTAFVISDTGIKPVRTGTNIIHANIYVNGKLYKTRDYEFAIADKVSMSNVIHNEDVGQYLPNELYTGSAITPTLSLTYRGYPLVEGVDYYLTYSNNVDVSLNGRYGIVTAHGMGDTFTGTKNWYFKIVADSSDIGEVVVPTRPSVKQVYLSNCVVILEDMDHNNTYERMSILQGKGTITDISAAVSEYLYEINEVVVYPTAPDIALDLFSGMPALSYVYLLCDTYTTYKNNLITDYEIRYIPAHGMPSDCHEDCPLCGAIMNVNNNHVWADVDEVDPTCTTDGHTAGRECTVCGKLDGCEIIPSGHTNIVTDEAKDPTCKVPGLTEGSHCEACGEVIVAQEIIPKLPHDVVTIDAVPATCVTSGHTAGSYCAACDEVFELSVVIPAGHANVVTDASVEATCTETGLTAGSHCEDCGTIILAQEEIPALGHSVVVDESVAATCTTDGITAGTHCSRCEEVIVAQETVPAMGHNEVTDDAVEPTCIDDGLTEGLHCSRCDAVIMEQVVVPALDHSVVEDEAVEPTCVADGVTVGYHCDRCNMVLEEQEIIPRLGHDEVTDEAVAPTCTTTGLTEGSHCSRCDDATIAQEVIPALGHDLVTDDAVDPTCTEIGLTSGQHCSRCDYIEVPQTEIPHLGHDEVIDEAVPATCSSTGLTEGSHCDRCGDVIVAQEVIEKLPHTVVIDSEVPATCTTTGLTEGSHCSVCGEVIVAQEVIEMLPHTVVTDEAVPATCETNGLTEGSHCSVCLEVFVEQVVVPMGHNNVETIPAVPATCTTDGLTAGVRCLDCETIIVDQEVVEAFGHTEVVDEAVPATCTTIGYTEGSHCSTCETVLVAQEIIPVLGHIEVIDTGKPATCTSTGLTDGLHCSRCNEVLVPQEVIFKTQHTLVTIPGKPATCTASGLTDGSYCSVCGTVIATQHTRRPLGHQEVIRTGTPATCFIDGTTDETYCERCNRVITPSEVIPAGHTRVTDPMVPASWDKTGLTEGSHCSSCGEVFVPQEVIPVETGASGFVERLYTIAMDRNSDPSGKDFWLDGLDSGLTGADVAREFIFSKEFKNADHSDEEFITILYQTFFGRNPDAGGMNFYLTLLDNGVSREEVFNSFIDSQEWANLCYLSGIESGGTKAPTVERTPAKPIIDFATRLYSTCLNRNGDEAGIMFWARDLDKGRITGTEAAYRFFFGSEFTNANVKDDDFIARLYRTCLDREGDTGGVNYYATLLRNGWTRERVFYAFVDSPEFVELCINAGINP